MNTNQPKSASELSPELLERARAGDRDALTDLYEATELEVYRTVHSILRDEELCRDVQQDAYIRAFSRLDQLKDPAAFLPWLRQIAVNEARMQLRRNRPLLFSELSDEADAADPELPDVRPEASPELSYERKENARLVREILDGLPDGQRLLLGMYYYEEMPVKQIAADTGLSEGTVKTQLFRGRKRVEAAVKRLEEKGVKLYGLSPLAFLLALLKRQEPAAELGKSVLNGALTRSGLASAAEAAGSAASTAAASSSVSAAASSVSAAAPAAEAAAIHVGRSFFQTALGKVVLGVIAAAAIGGGIAGYRWYQDHIGYGDYQPPTETLEINLHADTDEDLTTEPTFDTEELPTDPATPEDLVPETTDPEETTEPPVTTVPEEPTKPTQPLEPSEEATEPSETTKPEPSESVPAEETTEIVGWSLANNYPTQTKIIEIYQHYLNTFDFLTVCVKGTDIPTLSSDAEYVSKVVSYQGKEDIGDGKYVHHWELVHQGFGTASFYCELNGRSTKIATVNNPEPEKSILVSSWLGRGEVESINDARQNVTETLYLLVSGMEKPQVFSDNANISVSLYDTSSNNTWYTYHYYYKIQPDSPGTAHITVKLNGNTVKTFTITVLEEAEPRPETNEDLTPNP